MSMLFNILYNFAEDKVTPKVDSCPEYEHAAKLQTEPRKIINWDSPTWFNVQGAVEEYNNYDPGNNFELMLMQRFCVILFILVNIISN